MWHNKITVITAVIGELGIVKRVTQNDLKSMPGEPNL